MRTVPFHAKRAVTSATLTLLVFLSLGPFTSGIQAGLIGGLGPVRELANNTFEVDFFVAAMADIVGDQLDFINLDVVNTSVNSVPVTDFDRVEFSAVGEFAPWQGTEQFGQTVGFESVVSLDAFTPGATSVTFNDTTPTQVGTFLFDYSGLGLGVGDQVTLDISGANDGTLTRTTSGAVFDTMTLISELQDFDFSTSLGPDSRTFTIMNGGGGGVIPEPNAIMLVLLSGATLSLRRSRRRSIQRQ